jgi:hypothetical protein
VHHAGQVPGARKGRRRQQPYGMLLLRHRAASLVPEVVTQSQVTDRVRKIIPLCFPAGRAAHTHTHAHAHTRTHTHTHTRTHTHTTHTTHTRTHTHTHTHHTHHTHTHTHTHTRTHTQVRGYATADASAAAWMKYFLPHYRVELMDACTDLGRALDPGYLDSFDLVVMYVP